jgi:iron-sulfur cluster assembly protein
MERQAAWGVYLPPGLPWPVSLTVPRSPTTLGDMIAGTSAANATQAQAPAFRRGDERLVRLTPAASDKVRSLLGKQGRPDGVLRVAVVGGGCSGLQYKMDLQDRPQNRDIVVESQGVQVVVDPKSALYVTGSELDYLDALQGGGFKVRNPNAATSCSCGESFSA